MIDWLIDYSRLGKEVCITDGKKIVFENVQEEIHEGHAEPESEEIAFRVVAGGIVVAKTSIESGERAFCCDEKSEEDEWESEDYFRNNAEETGIRSKCNFRLFSWSFRLEFIFYYFFILLFRFWNN